MVMAGKEFSKGREYESIYQVVNFPNDKFAKIYQKTHPQLCHYKRHPQGQEQKGTEVSKL
jgi:hypothetical protein